MQWLHAPATFEHDSAANRLTVTADPRTDFWRKTYDNGIRDNGHFFYAPFTGDFTLTVKVSGAYRHQYDHAGAMVRVDAEHWLKCGIEFYNGAQYASAVIARDYADWSIVPLGGAPSAIWLRVRRRDTTLEVDFSLDGEQYTMMRQGHLPMGERVDVGLMCASPLGEGFTVTFEDYAVNAPA